MIRPMLQVFQSTLPARGATLSSARNKESKFVFQSTLPARGATADAVRANLFQKFQSTLPARGATGLSQNVKPDQLFQSTLPARGATLEILANNIVYIISIHAPRTGSDVASIEKSMKAKVFQSTLPARGATMALSSPRSTAPYFNPRSPHGERLSAI